MPSATGRKNPMARAIKLAACGAFLASFINSGCVRAHHTQPYDVHTIVVADVHHPGHVHTLKLAGDHGPEGWGAGDGWGVGGGDQTLVFRDGVESSTTKTATTTTTRLTTVQTNVVTVSGLPPTPAATGYGGELTPSSPAVSSSATSSADAATASVDMTTSASQWTVVTSATIEYISTSTWHSCINATVVLSVDGSSGTVVVESLVTPTPIIITGTVSATTVSGTGGFFTSTNGTWTAPPSATSNIQTAGAAGMKMAGANVAGAMAAALLANLI